MSRFLFPLGVLVLLIFSLPGLILFVGDLFGQENYWNQILEDTFGLSHHLPLAPALARFLLLIPILIVLLYFLRLKRKAQVISSTYLWKKSIEDLRVNRLLQWLRKNSLLLLQLGFVFTLFYAILSPKINAPPSFGKHYILMIDNSASMKATDMESDRLDWAKREAIKQIDASSDTDLGMVIVFNANAEIRQSYTSNKDLLRSAVNNIEGTLQVTRIEEALRLAESLANPTRSTENEAIRPLDQEPGKERTYVASEGIPTEVHLYSDGQFPVISQFAMEHLSFLYHPPLKKIGKSATIDPEELIKSSNNVAVVSMRPIRTPLDPNQLQIQVDLMNYRAETVTVQLVLEKLEPVRKKLLDVMQRKILIPGRAQVKRPQRSEKEEENEKTGAIDSEKNNQLGTPGQTSYTFDIPNSDSSQSVLFQARITDANDIFEYDDSGYLAVSTPPPIADSSSFRWESGLEPFF